MRNTTEDRRLIRAFFDDQKAASAFRRLYLFQKENCDGIILEAKDSIIGFKRPGEHFRVYVAKNENGYSIKIKNWDHPVKFNPEHYADYKIMILENDAAFERDPERFLLQSKAPSEKKPAAKKSRAGKKRANPAPEETPKIPKKPAQKTDLVLAKLSGRDTSRTFSEKEFADLTDWKYCPSFCEQGYVCRLPDGTVLECDSNGEVAFVEYLIANELAKTIRGQRLCIKYHTAFRKEAKYYPDIVFLTRENHVAIVECKAVTAMSQHRNLEKYEALRDYCEKHGYEYMMIDVERDNLTFEELRGMKIPEEIREAAEKHAVSALQTGREAILEESDVSALYEKTKSRYSKGQFELFLHAFVIQKGWYNKYQHGFMVFEKPTKQSGRRNDENGRQ